MSGSNSSDSSSGGMPPPHVEMPPTATPVSVFMQPNPAPMQYVVTRTPLPQPGTADALMFDGTNTTSFLRQFENMCEDHGMVEPWEIMCHLPNYCDVMIGDWMCSLSSYEQHNWPRFCKEIHEVFESDDIDQKVHKCGYLEAYKNQP